MAAIVVDYFSKLLCFAGTSQEANIIDDVIPTLVDSNNNRILTLLPTNEEISYVVFKLNKSSAPGPYVMKIFKTGWLLPNYNANLVIMIPKTKEVDTIEMFITIALSNFKYKIASKILADQLSTLMSYIISKEQKGFINGRNIRDYTCLSSKAINALDNNCFHGNLAFKIDIAKYLDTIR